MGKVVNIGCVNACSGNAITEYCTELQNNENTVLLFILVIFVYFESTVYAYGYYIFVMMHFGWNLK